MTYKLATGTGSDGGGRIETGVMSALSADLSAVAHCAKAEATGEGRSYTGAFLKPVLGRKVAPKRKAGGVEAAE